MGLRDRLIEHLIHREGLKLRPYKDTMDKLSIGVGRNLDGVGISTEEAMILLQSDVNRVFSEAPKVVHNFGSLSEDRQLVILSMIFNMGSVGLGKFKNMIVAVEKSDFKLAASEMMNSRWASQVGARATELAEMMRKG